MRQSSFLVFAAATLAMPSSATAQGANLARECKRVHAVYPRLIIAAMLEGEVNCGDPGRDEFVSCYAGESTAEKAAREHWLAIRKHQEAGYGVANDACRAWDAGSKDAAHRKTLELAITEARATDNWHPDVAAADALGQLPAGD